MDAVTRMVGSIVGQHNLSARRAVGLPSRNVLAAHFDTGYRISGPVATARTGMNLNMVSVDALPELGRDPRLAGQHKHMLDFEIVDLQGLDRQVECLAAGG